MPSLVATMPETFNEAEAKSLGAWESQAYSKYQRLKGVTRRITYKKVMGALKVPCTDFGL